jgi:hypothetical protein
LFLLIIYRCEAVLSERKARQPDLRKNLRPSPSLWNRCVTYAE